MIDRNQVKAELTMRIRFAAGGTTPVSSALLENALALIEDDEKRLAELEGENNKFWSVYNQVRSIIGDADGGEAKC